jgi:exodeoxyribonuclease VII large subunit
MSFSHSTARIDFARDLYSVSRLNAEVRSVLAASFPLVWVQGELSNLSRPASGHLYFSLKDEASQVRCALFRNKGRLLRFQPSNGQQVLVRARLGLYEPRGDFQLLVEHMEAAGKGALRLALEQCKQRLAAEGLFAESRKRPLPAYPRQVGLITSASGAALQDLLIVLGRRFPLLPVLIYPVQVQGAGAVASLLTALELANRRQDCDLLVLARGGGALEDLMPFNDEDLARALAASTLPVVTGIGHEVDLSIADLVADQRGATPSAAAALVVPDAADVKHQLQRLKARLTRAQRHRLAGVAQRLAASNRQLQLLHPRARLEQRSQRIDALSRRLEQALAQRAVTAERRLEAMRQRLQQRSPSALLRAQAEQKARVAERLLGAAGRLIEQRRQRLATLAAGLQARSPLATLARGYALVTDPRSGEVVRTPQQVAPGQTVEVRVAGGGFAASVLASSVPVDPTGSASHS